MCKLIIITSLVYTLNIYQSIGLNLQCFFFPTYAIIILNREGFHDWRREYEETTIICISALCIGACGM